MSNHEEFYKSYTDTLAAFARASRAEHASGYGFEQTLERKYEEGFADAMRHAFMLLTGSELDPERYETTCEDAECAGDCDSNYCENIYDNCDHDKYSESPHQCSQHSPVYPFVPDGPEDCWEMRCDNCNQVTLHQGAEPAE